MAGISTTPVEDPGVLGTRRIRSLTLAAIALLTVLNLADVATTHLLLDHKVAMEANPLAGILLGNGLILWAKLVFIGALGLSVLRRERPRVGVMVAAWSGVGLYAAAVLSNLFILRLLATLH
ncbi:MAG TPA: DUF5658 family protein [Acidimicrobiales bacterium]|nr:DUF5658 family protein [Acidimicrobiales bacterium]